MNVTPLPLPEANPLFRDYLADAPATRPFFRTHYRGDWRAHLAARAAATIDRAALVEVLSKQNAAWGAGESTHASLELLRDDRTLAVVTGQQAGVFGGPLYTLYKTLSTLQLTARLNRDWPDYRFVPVFWMEVNDADFEEIRAVRYPDRNHGLGRLALGQKPGEELMPVGMRTIGADIRRWFDLLREDLHPSAFREDIFALFADAYRAGAGLGDAFASLLHRLLPEAGLIIINPGDDAVAALGDPLVSRVLNDGPDLLAAFHDHGRNLEAAGYGLQIQLREDQTFLFYTDERRRRVRIDQGGSDSFRLHYPDGATTITRAALETHRADRPAALTPNVALRPVMQDYLLPTAAYVAGPSEAAYFAQLLPLYDAVGIPMPVVQPRHRLTLVEPRVSRVVERLELDYREILSREEGLVGRWLRHSGARELFEAAGTARQRIEAALTDLEGYLKRVDPPLLNSLNKTRGHVERSFHTLSGKIERSVAEKEQARVRQLERVILHLTPQGNLQERVFGMLPYLAAYGPELAGMLLEVFPDDPASHFLVHV